MAEEIDSFMEILDGFTNKAFEMAKKHKEDGLAYNHFGRYVSCFMGVKTLLFTLNLSSSNKDFDQLYIQSLPNSFPRKDVEVALAFIKETRFAIRFILFQNFYSQTEFTFRKIIREKHSEDKTKRHPLELIAEEYKIMDSNAPHFIYAIRNTIHNNGYYFPHKGGDKEYSFLNKKFKFEIGKPIDEVSMDDILNIIGYILNETINLFNIDELAAIKFE